MADAALQRKNMVESQIRPSDVTDRRVTAAMTSIPREGFVPAGLASLAYSDESLLIAPGREILPPRVLAKLIQLTELNAAQTALVISSAGYAAAIVSQLAGSVVALLPDDDSVKVTSKMLASLAIGNVKAVAGAPAQGWQPGAPYDVVLIEAGIQEVPDALKDQTRDNGRLVAVSVDGGLGHAVVFHKRSGLLTRRDDFQASAPLLSGFAQSRPAFVF